MVAKFTLLQERKRKEGREKERAKRRKNSLWVTRGEKFASDYLSEMALPLTLILKNSPK